MKQASALFPAIALISLHVFPNTSDFFSLLQFLLGPPLLRFPWGLQLKTHSSTAKESFLSECPIHFHFPTLICIATGSPPTLPCCSSMGIKLEQKMLIFCKAPLCKPGSWKLLSSEPRNSPVPQSGKYKRVHSGLREN